MANDATTTIAEPIPTGTYQLVGFVIVGNELRATVKTPMGDIYQGTVKNWQKVSAIEVLSK